MSLFGLLDHESHRVSAPLVRILATEPQTSDVCHVLLFRAEIDADLALERVPKALTQASPAQAEIEVRRHADSPWGAFSIAELKLVVRANETAMTYCLSAFCDNPKAAAYLGEHYGAPVRHGSIGLEKRYFGYEARVAADASLVFDGLLEKAGDLSPEEDLLTPTLNLSHFEGDLRLIQEERTFAVETAELGTARLRTFRADAFGDGRIRLTRALPAVWATGSYDYKSVQFVIDPSVPAAEGTTRVDNVGQTG